MGTTDLVLTSVIVLALILFMALPCAAAAYLWRLHHRDPHVPKLWLPRVLAIAVTAWSFPTVYLGIIAIVRTIWGLAGVPEWTSALTTAAVIVMGASGAYVLVEFLRNT